MESIIDRLTNTIEVSFPSSGGREFEDQGASTVRFWWGLSGLQMAIFWPGLAWWTESDDLPWGSSYKGTDPIHERST